jgi:hypothetical protein
MTQHSKTTKANPTIAPKLVRAKAARKPKAPSIESQRRAALNDKTLPELKAMLKRNDQITTGTKTKLIKRVIECVTHGTLPRCPECGLGRLRLNRYYGFSCPGGFDDDEYMFCGYTIGLDEIERPAWQYETPGGLF